jgi:hypothetical protein
LDASGIGIDDVKKSWSTKQMKNGWGNHTPFLQIIQQISSQRHHAHEHPRTRK